MADKKISELNASTTPLAGTEVLPIVQSGSTKKVAVSDLTAGRSVAASNLRVGGATINYAATEIQQAVLGASRGIIVLGPAGNFTDGAVSMELRATGTAIQGSNNATQIPLNLNPDGGDVSVGANLAIATAGKGIDFTVNTPAAGMTSQLLNWYEEGTWTPVIAGDVTSGTYQLDAATKCSYTRIGRVVHLQANIKTAGSITGGGVGNLTISGLPYSKSSGTWPVGAAQVSYIDYTVGGSLSTGWGTSAESNILYLQFSMGNGGVGYIDVAGLNPSETIRFNMTYEVA